jgi:hypothetical protein
MHYIPDVLASLAMAPFLTAPEWVWDQAGDAWMWRRWLRRYLA